MTPSAIDEAMRQAAAEHRSGRLSEAETLYRLVLASFPNHPDALHLLGVVAVQNGRADVAIPLIQRAIALRPSVAHYHSNLGDALRKAGRLNEAAGACRRAVELNPQGAEGYNNLGNALMDAGQLDEAIAAYSDAIRAEPESASYHNHLGNALNHCGRYDEAVSAYRAALTLEPDHADALTNLGNTNICLGKIDEAIAACQSAVELQPGFADAHRNLGFALTGAGRIDEALASHRQAMALRSDDPKLHSDLLFALHYHPKYDPQDLFREHREWNQRHAGPLRGCLQPHSNDPAPERPLRIGYVSPDFCNHVLGRNLLALFRHHDPQRYEIFAYATTARRDSVFDELHSRAKHWRNLVGVSDQRAAEMIREDRIDILVDLALHTAGGRLPLFARKPAPVQVTFLGYCSTTGLDAIDYRLSDPYLDPPDADFAGYSEETIRLRRSYWCYEPLGPVPPVAPAPVVENGYLMFGCLNNFAKVSAAALDSWGEILRAIPTARLLLQAPSGSSRAEIVQRFAGVGIQAERVGFVGHRPWEQYVQSWQGIDIALDPFPYGGGVTTSDALWMGVPVVTLSGRTAVGRGGRSILSNLGLTELVAETPRQYVEIAVSLAGDLPRLVELRAGLRDRVKRSPLCDAPGYAADLEMAYREMWSRWCMERKTA